MIAIPVVLAVLAAAGVVALGHLPRLAAAAVFGLVVVLTLFAVLALAVVLRTARARPAAPAPPPAPPPAWTPDPADPQVGTTIGRHRLLRRLGDVPWGTRYDTEAGVLDRLERRPLDDDALAAYGAASSAAHVQGGVIAEVELLRDVDGTPVLAWALAPRRGTWVPALTPGFMVDSPAAVHALCERVGRLHAAGAPTARSTCGTCCPARPRRWPVLSPPRCRCPPPPTVLTDTSPPDGDAEHLAPEQRAGGPATPRADVYALAGFLAATLREPPHLPDVPAWAELVAAARADDPGARPADATALARAILRAAATVAPAAPFAGKTFRRCDRCGAHLLAEDPPAEILFDGVDRDGRRTGGRSRTWTGRCVGCDHQTRCEETQRY
jgi:hypothetical protein